MNGKQMDAYRTIGHPERYRIMLACLEAPVSARELAETRRQTSRVAYHFKVLEQRGLIQVAHTRQVRGATQTFYTTTNEGTALIAQAR